ncbi:pyridoxamine 5'-phosphate oxidase family protein [Anaeromicropila herbilytica]|uniref:NimC/NimA family protein n=1 Tax=Anaeromicropila herbilytica TaxID=2785025 RepID=A0A7R7EI30_9FIRM|nr:pyridoxamine 5'-phosphate oxidase family protein [Anaeromicropila herbilytica]BCN29120.1 NimC/NimA family protein [Anaeromicropila herbilytica]
MQKTIEFLRKANTFYLATVEKDQPRVRPFGAVAEYDGKFYICTNNTKDCFKQMQENTKVEISAMTGGSWIRLTGEVKADERVEAKQAMIDANPSLKNMYKADDDIFEVLYFTKGTSTFYSFTNEPETEVIA